MPPCPPHLAHTASRVSSPTCLPSFHLIFLSSDLFAAACLFSCFFPYSGSFSCFPAFHRTSSIAYTPAKYARISPPCLVKEQGIRTISFRLFARFSWNSPRICPAVSGFLLSTTVSQYFASVYRYAYGNASSGNVFSTCPNASRRSTAHLQVPHTAALCIGCASGAQQLPQCLQKSPAGMPTREST